MSRPIRDLSCFDSSISRRSFSVSNFRLAIFWHLVNARAASAWRSPRAELQEHMFGIKRWDCFLPDIMARWGLPNSHVIWVTNIGPGTQGVLWRITFWFELRPQQNQQIYWSTFFSFSNKPSLNQWEQEVSCKWYFPLKNPWLTYCRCLEKKEAKTETKPRFWRVLGEAQQVRVSEGLPIGLGSWKLGRFGISLIGTTLLYVVVVFVVLFDAVVVECRVVDVADFELGRFLAARAWTK